MCIRDRNIVNVSSINGKTVNATLTNSDVTGTTVLTCAADKVLKINSIVVSNYGANVNATVQFYDSSATNSSYLAHRISVPDQSSLVVLGKDTSIYLEESDQIKAGIGTTSTTSTITISYEELDDA